MSRKNTTSIKLPERRLAHYTAPLIARFQLYLLLLLCGVHGQLLAMDYEKIKVSDDHGAPLVIEHIRVLSVFHLFTTEFNNLSMVELSGLAWSADEQLLYAINDRGSLFHLRPVFDDTAINDIQLVDAYPLRSQSGGELSYPWSDSEGLFLRNGANGIAGDDELLISFENRPRLQWHSSDGAFLSQESLPGWLTDPATYHRRSKALESVAIHPDYGVITAPEYPLAEADWNQLTLYRANGEALVAERDNDRDFALCAIEVMPDGRLLALQRRYSLLAPTWTTRLEILSPAKGNRLEREEVAEIVIGSSRLPIDNYEGLTHHRDNRYFMISDDNGHFIQQTLLVYFELLE
ncbi:MAG TPA: esterase-like activity of phytase family protein [Gammaproteobacteria bacterium]